MNYLKKLLAMSLAIILILNIGLGLLCNYTAAEEQNIIESDVFADLAFPTAEGYGRFANGFRGGKVVKVTNLNAEGEGSLRWALEEVSGPRIVVFEVGGVINLEKSLDIKDGDVYIAGQTAPGDGITLCNNGITMERVDNVIVRNIRVRGLSGISMDNVSDCIIDHCSFSWGKINLSVTNSENVTVQNCIIAESMYRAFSEETIGIMGLEVGSGIKMDVTNGTFFNNLITNCAGKTWFMTEDNGSVSGPDAYENNNVEICNNVVYNWFDKYLAYSYQREICECSESELCDNCVFWGKSRIDGNTLNLNFINNYYKKGKDTAEEYYISGRGSAYLSGNVMYSNSGEKLSNDNDWEYVPDVGFSDGRKEEICFNTELEILSAEDAYESVMKNAGAIIPERDYIDERYIYEVKNGIHTYTSTDGLYEGKMVSGIINEEVDAEGYPDNTTFKGGEAPLDTDADGMPDEWEVEHGLDPDNYYDACQVYLSDEGYTNIELYINELAGDPVKYSDNPTIQYTPAIPEPTETPDISDVFADLAFPTAEGYGRFANGFRGGKVVKVTNLNAEGEGSLRWALEEVGGPRIVVFEVGGVINLDETELKTPITIKEDNVYIAGQTAPGDGITIVGDGINIAASNVVVRDLRIRAGDSTWFGSGIRIYSGKENIIIDHCSLSWGECSNINISNAKNVTVQNCILSESVGYHGASDALSYYLRSGSAVESNVENGSFYRNLITNTSNKVWGFSYDYDETIDSAESDNSNIDIRNNVVYNWYSATSGIASNSMQFVNNYYKKGEKTQNDILLTLNGAGYLAGNKLVDNKGLLIVDSEDENPWKLASEDSFPEGKSENPLFDAGTSTLSADEAYSYVLENAGANVPERDAIDTRYVNEVKNGTHTYGTEEYVGFISSQNDAEGYPDNTTFTGGEAPLDTDADGMPDEWEVKHGLNPDNYYDACQVYLSDEGYTNIELYINELAGDPVKYSDNPTIQYTPATPEPTFTPAPTETEAPTEMPFATGDVNADGIVSAEDALEVLKHAAKLDILSEEKLLRADVERDDFIDAKDALAILKIAAKIL